MLKKLIEEAGAEILGEATASCVFAIANPAACLDSTRGRSKRPKTSCLL